LQKNPKMATIVSGAVRPTPHFSAFLFWDSNPDKIDYHRDRNKVIRRAFDMGLIEDVTEAIWYYTREELIEALTTASYLPQNALLLASALFHLKLEDFKCSTSIQLHPLS
jgi:hypothetical protein